jgi:hypothetical protein
VGYDAYRSGESRWIDVVVVIMSICVFLSVLDFSLRRGGGGGGRGICTLSELIIQFI